ncbi:MAG: hypothetical protein IPN42_07745 [Methylococcaceae bacterium]|nr:hypothetical protein [Methylococcaceae bacterium]
MIHYRVDQAEIPLIISLKKYEKVTFENTPTPQRRLGQDTQDIPRLPHLQRLPEGLRQRVFCSQPPGVGKETRETAHMQRWNNSLRQRVGRMVRKALSFSKDATWHDGVIH